MVGETNMKAKHVAQKIVVRRHSQALFSLDVSTHLQIIRKQLQPSHAKGPLILGGREEFQILVPSLQPHCTEYVVQDFFTSFFGGLGKELV
jgi:hypothetical protein